MTAQLLTPENPFPIEAPLQAGRQRMWLGEYESKAGRFTSFEPNQTFSYSGRLPDVSVIAHGALTTDTCTYEAGDYFILPAERNVKLRSDDNTLTFFTPEADTSDIVSECESTLAFLYENGIGTAEWYELPRSVQYEKLFAITGNTPLETIQLDENCSVTVKLEANNPSGSHYDRAYLLTLATLENEGFIQKGDELRDITSGSAGISLALLGNLLGYSVRITVPSELPPTRIFPMLAYGAKVTSAGPGYVPAAADMQVHEISELKENPNFECKRPSNRNSRAFLFTGMGERVCFLNHSENDLSPIAFQEIGRELVRQVPKAPEALVLAIGNWTTIAGIAPVIRDAWPATQIIGYEGEQVDGPHNNYGTTVNGVRIRYEDSTLLDQRVSVRNQERDALDTLVNADRESASRLGHSSLMGLAIARQLLSDNSVQSVVSLVYDHKTRY